MGNVIALELNVKSCLGFADRFIQEEKFLDAIINLNDALKFAKTNEEKREIYARYLYLLTQTSNFGSAYTIFCKLIYTYCSKDCYIFDGVDMVLRDSLLFSNPNVLYSFDGIDITSREDFIMIREFVKNEDYQTLFDALPIIAKPSNPYFNDMMRLSYEATQRSSFNVSKDIVLKSAMQLYPVAPENPHIISLLLESKDQEIIKVLEKGYRLQIEKADDDYFDLLRIGRAYMLSKRYSVAAKFFAKIMQQNKYDEETLWTAAQNYYLMGDVVKGRKLLNIYAAFFQCSDAPIKLFRAYMDSDCVEPLRYPLISKQFINQEIKRLEEFFKVFAPSQASVGQLEDLFKVAGDKYKKLYAIVSKYPCEAMQEAILRMISSMRINSFHKRFLFKELVESGFEGGFEMVYKDRIYCANILRLRARGIDDKYFELYKEIVSMIPFCHEIVPLKCSVLAEITKKVAKEIEINKKYMEGVAKFVIFDLYTKKLRIKIDKKYYMQLFNKTRYKDFEKLCINYNE